MNTEFKARTTGKILGKYNEILTLNWCPVCKAAPGYDCVSRNGKRKLAYGRSEPHAARIPSVKRFKGTNIYQVGRYMEYYHPSQVPAPDWFKDHPANPANWECYRPKGKE
jgi:hypothetical protein